jgi:hypothetical protein
MLLVGAQMRIGGTASGAEVATAADALGLVISVSTAS